MAVSSARNAAVLEEPFYLGYDIAGYELGLLPNGDAATEH